jgi:hypothetical protein
MNSSTEKNETMPNGMSKRNDTITFKEKNAQ